MCKPFFQEYLLYLKEKWGRTAGKESLCRHADGFQIDPNWYPNI